MALFSGKLVAGILAGWLLLGLITGYVHWNTDPHKCFEAKRWSFGGWGTFIAVGRFELRDRLINYDCEPDQKYNVQTQQIKNNGLFIQVLPKTQ